MLIHFDLNKMFLSIACFAGGHNTIYQEHLQTLDIHFRKFCRSIVGPPPYIGWTLAWHEIFTLGTNEQHTLFAVRRLGAGPETVAVRIGNWRLILLNTPTHHWIRRVWHWQPVRQRRLGRPTLCSESKLDMYCRYQGLVH